MHDHITFKSETISVHCASTSAANSTFLISTDVRAFDTIVASVNARDSAGNLVGVGGDTFYLHVENYCQRSAASFDWVSQSGIPNVLQSQMYILMTDNGDGSYNASFTVQLNGTFTAYAMQGNVCLFSIYW